MQVKYVLFVFYCAVPLLLHMVDSQEYCIYRGYDNDEADCTPSDTNRTFDYVPRISQSIIHIRLDGQPLKQLPRNAFRNVSSQNELTEIRLHSCQIRHIDADAFVNLDNLTFLVLDNNSISHFETGTFQHTKQLEYLIADNNKIEKLQTGLFHNLVHLNFVYFKNNSITCIDKDTFRNTSLFVINVRHNKLEYLSPSFTDDFISLNQLYVEDNPWNCNCNLKELYEEYKVNYPKLNPALVCENPPKLRGRKWFDLTSDAFICDTRESIRELISTITINEPGIIIKESGTRIKELSTSNGPNATTTVEVTMNVVLQVPKNLTWLQNVLVTPVRITHGTNKTSVEAS